MVGENQRSAQFGENLKSCKRLKLRDIDSGCSSDGKSLEMIENNHQFVSSDKEKSQELNKEDAMAFANIVQTEITSKTLPSMRDPGIISFDLNAEVRESNYMTSIGHGATIEKSKGFCWDLNADEKSSHHEDPSFLSKNRESMRLSDESECGSTTGPLKDKDPMKVWKEMKQNGFLSSSHVSITVPKQRGRKSKNDGLKKKMELAKKEQVDRFAKIAAPSGLLNELNPGIINHVRNRKQVHSIIEALVKLEKTGNHQSVGKQDGSAKSCGKDGYFNSVSQVGSLSTGGSLQFGPNQSRRESNPKVERWFFDKNSCPLPNKKVKQDDVLALKLASSTTMGSENISSLSNVESANLGTISSLSVKAASVAYQWLELLRQDIYGRLAALRRSKKRVQSVVSTELPLLMSREFSDSQENEPHFAKNIADLCSLNENADAHRVKWNALFDQMDKTLSEEEKHLEIWLQQVIEMQSQCEKGLHDSQRPGASETDHRLEEAGKLERELAVRAAAASIYSTCNFLSSKENLPCI